MWQTSTRFRILLILILNILPSRFVHAVPSWISLDQRDATIEGPTTTTGVDLASAISIAAASAVLSSQQASTPAIPVPSNITSVYNVTKPRLIRDFASLMPPLSTTTTTNPSPSAISQRSLQDAAIQALKEHAAAIPQPRQEFSNR